MPEIKPTPTDTKSMGEQDNILDYDDTLEQIKEEIRKSREYVSDKRQTFRNRLKLYNNQRKQKDKVGDTSIFNVMTTMLAVYYSDEMQVSFSGRELSDTPLAQNVEHSAKFDHDEMGMDVLNYMTQWDRLFFGVGIRQCSEWDNDTKTPVAKSLAALSWLPDPKGGMDAKYYRWQGFEVEYTRSEMTEEAGFFNLPLLKNYETQRGSDQDQTRDAYAEAQGLNDVESNNTGKAGDTFDMVDHFTILKGSDGKLRKYLVTVDDAVKNIFRCEEIEPLTPKEKENPHLVPFPITLNFYAPSREDPFGTSVPDLVEDKQRAKSVFKNLRLAAEKANLYPMYLYNRDKILNRRDLDFAFNKFIAVRGDVDSGVVQPLNKAPSTLGNSLNNEQSLDSDIEVSTGTDKNAQGVLSDQQRTLGEVQQTQANANLRYLLGSKINAWGEKRFWKLWYRLYKQNFQEAEVKVVRIKSALGSQFVKISRKTFITNQDPDIYIGSKLEIEQKRQRDRVAFASVVPLLLQDPSTPNVSRNFIKRHLLRLNNITLEEISIMVPDSPDEMKAKMENELLVKNNNDAEVDVMREDHLSHMLIHSQTEPTPASIAHIQAHRIAYFESGQYAEIKEREKAMIGNNNSNANIMANSNANMDAKLNNNNAPGSNPTQQ